LITGAAGRLGHQLCRYLVETGRAVVGLTHVRPIAVDGVTSRTADLRDGDALVSTIEEEGCSYVVHAAGNTDVDDCEARPEAAEQINVAAAACVATAASRSGAAFVGLSTDHLWDGTRPFVDEETPPQPMNVYARTKYLGERVALAAHRDALILRTNFFGPGRPWKPSFSDWIETGLSEGRTLTMFDDAYFTPISMALLCPIIVEMAERRATGVYHAVGSEPLSKYSFGVRLAESLGYDTDRIVPVSIDDADLKAPRPKDMSLAVGKIERFLGRKMPDCRESLRAHVGRSAERSVAPH
jgi:dTDP-4-dehydrorhamnose reductase